MDTNSKDDWELTTSGDAPGPITRDTDDLSCDSNDRISSAGKNNNGIDYGDAPSSYGDAGSAVDSDIYMGAGMPDYEDSSQYSANADGDDTDGNDDEDGISSFPTLKECDTSYSVQVSVTNSTGSDAYLRGWINFDGDGAFDSDEASDLTTVPDGTSGTVTLTWSSVPADAAAGDTYVRVHLSTESLGTSDATGIIGTGEVEDYPITIQSCGPTISDPKVDELHKDRDGNGAVSPGDIIKYTVRIENVGTDTAKNVVFSDAVDPHTSLLCFDPYAPQTTKGTVTGCTPGKGGNLEVAVGDLAPGESVTIIFYVEIVDYVEEIANQGLVKGDNFPDDPTDDPDTPQPDDPTVTPSCNTHDLNGDCILDIRDVRIAYKIAMGCIEPTERQRQAADVDGDGDVDMDDVSWYVEWVLGGGG